MDGPELAESGRLGCADELVRGAAQEVSPRLVAQRPATGTILGDANLEAGTGVAIVRLAEHVAERVHGEVFVQM